MDSTVSKRLCLVAIGMALMAAAPARCLAASSNPELQKLEEADQADRASGSNKIDWNIVGKRDAVRRERVSEIMRSGDLHSANDYWNAAIIFQHGDAVEDTQLAYALATMAARIDGTNKDAKLLMAQAWDRTMVKSGRPQWYGTQLSKDPATGKWLMPATDPTAVTEAQRESMGVPTLTETRAHLDALNAR
ncbi:hypothetical protein ACVWWJ_002268 [Luteibacter sp. HA06]|jgi:hypothetical protein